MPLVASASLAGASVRRGGALELAGAWEYAGAMCGQWGIDPACVRVVDPCGAGTPTFGGVWAGSVWAGSVAGWMAGEVTRVGVGMTPFGV
jgi:hypothetical protein